jgi:23S rRNA G2069 N7-methylase RlmK/C1962 C5-methylase RlmI
MDFGPQTILMGLGGVGLIGVLAIYLPKLLGRSADSKLLDQFKKDETQKRLQDEIVGITKEQKVIAAQVKASETASKETKEKIKKKLQKAAIEIQETLKEDNISTIDSQIDDDWDGM